MNLGRLLAHVVLSLLLGMLFVAAIPVGAEPPTTGATLYFFWGEGCPHCAKARPFLQELVQKYPGLEVKSYEVFNSRENMQLLESMAKAAGGEARGVPTFIIAGTMLAGFSPDIAEAIDARVKDVLAASAGKTRGRGTPRPEEEMAVSVPLLGKIHHSAVSLPVFTLIIAGLDSFNPCAFFVLFFLLSLLIHAHSRARMVFVGGTFVLFSGVIYFVFMAAWLNLFLLARSLAAITTVAALIALLVAVLNIKDFFFFKKGVSLAIPESARPRLFERMRRLPGTASLPAMLAGTVVLAVAANSYELLCTAGFPMVFTRVLTLHRLPTAGYYLYLAFYNTVYVVPLAVIVAFFTVTLGSRKLSEWQGRVLKLLSGLMMLGLGLVLLVEPALLSSAVVSAGLLAVTLLTAFIVVRLTRKFAPHLLHTEP